MKAILNKQSIITELNNNAIFISEETIESLIKVQLSSPENWLKQIAYVLYQLIMIVGGAFVATSLVILVGMLSAFVWGSPQELEMLTLVEAQKKIQIYFYLTFFSYFLWSLLRHRKNFKRNFFREALYTQLGKMREGIYENS